MIIAVDFDGTIVQDKYPEIGLMQPYARRVINALFDSGHYIIIWTCRNGDLALEAVNYLLEKKVLFNRFNDHEPHNNRQYPGDTRKVYADVYIDDRNFGGFPGWMAVAEEILGAERVKGIKG